MYEFIYKSKSIMKYIAISHIYIHNMHDTCIMNKLFIHCNYMQLNYDSDIYSKDNYGWTPFTYATENAQVYMHIYNLHIESTLCHIYIYTYIVSTYKYMHIYYVYNRCTYVCKYISKYLSCLYTNMYMYTGRCS